jgi:hypothetical protein
MFMVGLSPGSSISGSTHFRFGGRVVVNPQRQMQIGPFAVIGVRATAYGGGQTVGLGRAGMRLDAQLGDGAAGPGLYLLGGLGNELIYQEYVIWPGWAEVGASYRF